MPHKYDKDTVYTYQDSRVNGLNFAENVLRNL